jgi:hypothetical protein
MRAEFPLRAIVAKFLTSHPLPQNGLAGLPMETQLLFAVAQVARAPLVSAQHDTSSNLANFNGKRG